VADAPVKSVPNNSATPIDGMTQVSDDAGMFGAAAFTVTVPGNYIFMIAGSFAAAATGNRREVAITKNAANIAVEEAGNGLGAGGSIHISMSSPVQAFDAADVIAFTARQNSGGNLNFTTRKISAVRVRVS